MMWEGEVAHGTSLTIITKGIHMLDSWHIINHVCYGDIDAGADQIIQRGLFGELIYVDMISFDLRWTIFSASKHRRGLTRYTARGRREKLITLIQGKHECFMFEGTFEEDSNDGS